MKKRKIGEEVFESINISFQEVFLGELKGYKTFERKARKELCLSEDEDWKIKPNELKFVLRKESKKRLEELHEKYFGSRADWDKSRWKKRSRNKKEDYINTFLNKFYSEEDERKRGAERTNISELKVTDLSLFEMCGITIPRDVILHILSFLFFDFELLNTIGRVNSSFYLLILGNWRNSQVYIGSNDSLYKISLLVMKSLRHLTLDNIADFAKTDIKYLLENISIDRILSFGFEGKNSKTSIRKFFDICREFNVVFTSCESLYFDNNLIAIFNNKETVWQLYYNHQNREKPMDDYPEDIFVSVFPNVNTLYNPFLISGSICQKPFKMLSKVRHIYTHFKVRNYEMISSVCAFPEKLETFEMTNSPNDSIISGKIRLKNILKKLPNLRNFRFGVHSDFALLDWSSINQYTPKLESLTTMFNHRLFKRDLNVSFQTFGELPSSLKHLELHHPPFPLVKDIKTITSLKSLHVSFVSFRYYWEPLKQRDLESLIIEMDNFLKNVFIQQRYIEDFDITIPDHRNPTKIVHFLRLVLNRKLETLYFFAFCEKKPRESVSMKNTYVKKGLVESIQKYIRIISSPEEDNKEYVNVKRFYLGSFLKKSKKYWNEIIDSVVPIEDGVEMVQKSIEEKVIDPVNDGKWINYERRCYMKK